MGRQAPGFLFFIYGARNLEPAADLAGALRTQLNARVLLYCPTYLPMVESLRLRSQELGLPFVCGMRAGGGDNDVVSELGQRFPEIAPSSEPSSRARGRIGNALRARAARALTVPTLMGESWSYLTGNHYSASSAAAAGGSRPPAKLLLSRRPGRRSYVLAVAWLLRGVGAAKLTALSYWLNLYLTELDAADRVLSWLDPDLLVLPEENIDYNSAIWEAAQHGRGRRCVCISSSLPARSEVAAVYFDDAERQVQGRVRLAQPWLSRWFYRHRGRRLIRYPLERALAMELVGLAPSRPWVLNTGQADEVVVESPFMREQFAELGIDRPRGRVRVLGHPVFDRLHAGLAARASRRGELLCGFGMRDDKPLALCSLPTDQYATWKAPGLDSYDALLRFWVESLQRLTAYNGIVTPHPGIGESTLDRVVAWGGRVASQGAADLVPLADLFIAPVSTTSKWARACGLPVINYNTYQFEYLPAERAAYLDGFPGIHTVSRPEDYLALLDRFNDASFRAEAERVASQDRGYWGQIDGRARDRLVARLAQLAAAAEGQEISAPEA